MRKFYLSLFCRLSLLFFLALLCLILLAVPGPAEAIPTADSSSITTVTMNRSILRIYKGNMYQLYAKVSPRTTVTWRSTNSTVAGVDAYGMVRSRSKGTCRIYANAGGAHASCLVIVL